MSNVIVGNTTTITPMQAIQIGINPLVYKGEPGKAPRIGENGNWETYNNKTGEWDDTGVAAAGGGSGSGSSGGEDAGGDVVEFDRLPLPDDDESDAVVEFGDTGR